MVKNFYRVLKIKLVSSLRLSWTTSAREKNFSRSGNGVCNKSFNATLDTFAIAAVGTAEVRGD